MEYLQINDVIGDVTRTMTNLHVFTGVYDVSYVCMPTGPRHLSICNGKHHGLFPYNITLIKRGEAVGCHVKINI